MKTKVFISWSGHISKQVALALRDWLQDVIQDLEPWMSDRDINSGDRWLSEIGKKLSDTHFGIVCLTAHNLEKPWVLFEAGALAKSLEKGRLCPYLFEVESTELKGPLSMFQSVNADKTGTEKLIRSANTNGKTKILDDAKLKASFEKWWPDLKDKFEKIDRESEEKPKQKRDIEEKVDDILKLTRNLSRIIGPTVREEVEKVLKPTWFSGASMRSGPSTGIVPATAGTIFTTAPPDENYTLLGLPTVVYKMSDYLDYESDNLDHEENKETEGEEE